MVKIDKVQIIVILSLMLTTLYSCFSSRSYLIQREVYVECDKKGFIPRPTKSYKKYKNFRRITGREKLLELSQSENLALRTYSNWALIEKLDTGYIEIFEQLLQDTSEVFYGCGCTSSSEKISSTTYFNYFTSKKIFYNSEGEPLEGLETDEKLYKLDSLIIFSELQKDDLLWYALDHREFNSKDILDKIVELAIAESNEASANYIVENFSKESFKNHKSQILSLNPDQLSDFSRQLIEKLKIDGN